MRGHEGLVPRRGLCHAGAGKKEKNARAHLCRNIRNATRPWGPPAEATPAGRPKAAGSGPARCWYRSGCGSCCSRRRLHRRHDALATHVGHLGPVRQHHPRSRVEVAGRAGRQRERLSVGAGDHHVPAVRSVRAVAQIGLVRGRVRGGRCRRRVYLRRVLRFSVAPRRGCMGAGAMQTPEAAIEIIRRERAARLAAMFERWAAEDISDEPEWDVDQVERLRLRDDARAADS
jgi:hypothetical protein